MAQEVIKVPITGKVTSVEVKIGDKVKEEDTVCFIESMKMDNPILAPVAGKIVDIKVAPGQVVETGDTVAVIEY